MIRTRPTQEDEIAGVGEFKIAMSFEELVLISSFLGMVKLGVRPYQQAAMNLIDAIEELTADQDFTSFALSEIQPVLEVRDPSTFDIVGEFTDDHIFEFVV